MLKLRHLMLAVKGLLFGALATSSHGQDGESAAWERAKDLGTRAAYEDYLKDYPAGRFHSEAFAALVDASLSQDSAFEVSTNTQDLY